MGERKLQETIILKPLKSNLLINKKKKWINGIEQYFLTLDKLYEGDYTESYKEKLRKRLGDISLQNKNLESELRMLVIKEA